MASDKEIEEAVQAERDRCTQLLEAYRQNFEQSSDKWMGHLWCRIRNQIANGASVEEADLGVQLGFYDDEEDFEGEDLDDEFEEDDDEWHLDGGDHYPPPSQN